MRRVLPPKYDWRLAGYNSPMCGVGGRCYQMGDATDPSTAATIGATQGADAREFDPNGMFWRAVGVGIGVTLAVRIVDRLLLSRLF